MRPNTLRCKITPATSPAPSYVRRKRPHRWPAFVAALSAGFVATAEASPVILNPVQQLAVPAEGLASNSIAVHGNFILVGSRSFVGAPQPGTVRVYAKDNHCRGEACWSLKGELHRPDAFPGDSFGASVDFDGKTLLVGSPTVSLGEGAAAFVYKLEGEQFTAPQKLTGDPVPSEFDFFGGAVVVENNHLAITDLRAKATYVFKRSSEGVWLHEAKLQAANTPEGAQYGISVDLSRRSLVVGSDVPGYADVFERDGRTWREQQTLIPWDTTGGEFGRSVAIDGNRIAIGAYDVLNSGCGAAYLFRELKGEWAPEEKLETPGNDSCFFFGVSVLMHDHRLAVMGRDGIYIFDRQNSAWANSTKLVGPDFFDVTDSSDLMDWDKSTLAAAGWTGVWVYDLSGIEGKGR